MYYDWDYEEDSRMTLIKAPGTVHHEPIPSIHINNHLSSNHAPSEPKRKMTIRKICEIISRWLIYGTVPLFLGLNAFALLSQGNTIFYLRIYQLIVACIMLISSGVMIEFMIYANKHLIKLGTPHSIPRPMLISTLMLTIGIVLGYAYFIIFNLTFQDCDTLVDTLNPQEVWFDIIYEIAMIWFCSLAFFYLMQRSYYGGVDFHSDKMRRLWINASVCIAWIQIVVYKGYLSNQGLCQRKELTGYWCPVVHRNYTCEPSKLKGTRQIWYYLNKGLLNTSIIACASEFFPVVLVAHWLVCGGAEERAEDLIRKQRQKKSVRRVLYRFMHDISRIYGAAKHKHVSLPPLRTSQSLRYLLCIVSSISIVFVIAHWLIKFYYTILFDRLYQEGWMVDDFSFFANGFVQLFLYLLLYFWATRIEKRRFDAYHKAEARGDVVIVFGCCILLSVKSVLQFIEVDFQKKGQHLTTFSSILKIVSILITIGSQWLQFLSLRRILALSDRDVNASKSFLPIIAISAFIANCVNFGVTFFDTTIIKYQIAHEDDYGFSAVTLISMIITQTMYPADYLYAFTAAGCWMDLIYRYSKMGYFQLGKPSLDQLEFDNHSILSGATSRRSTHVEKRLSLPTISVHEAM